MASEIRKWTLPQKLHRYIYKKDYDRALRFLSKLTAINETGLFMKEDESYLRYVGAFRIQLLMEIGYYREALAWACLEIELYPKNMQAFIFKENLKAKINNLPENESPNKQIKNDAWPGIAGMREVKTVIEQDIIVPYNNPELYKKYKVPLPNGYLFYGPPGCGKTFIADNLAKKLGYHFIKISPGDIGSTYIHGTQLEIKKVFDDARINAPCVLFFDEFEAMAPKRNARDISFHYKSEVNELLTQLNNVSKTGVLFIAATNYVNSIDDAVMRPGRIDKTIFIGPPDFEARIESFRIQLQEKPIGKIKYDIISEMSEYYTHADIEAICNDAVRLAIAKNVLIDTDFLGGFVHRFRPKLNEEKLNEYFN